MAQVYNVIGSGQDKPRRTWRKYWEHHSDIDWPDECQSGNCHNPATEGAHVALYPNTRFVKSGGNVQGYIAPFCKDHNEKDPEFSHSVADKYLCQT